MADPIKKRIALGKPLQLTDEQLDQLAEVTPGDIEKAKAFWRSHAPAEFADLLDAETMEDEDDESTT
ncbi:MAG: hypothetical protein ACRD2L_06975 [Terriglobia bacterium]